MGHCVRIAQEEGETQNLKPFLQDEKLWNANKQKPSDMHDGYP